MRSRFSRRFWYCCSAHFTWNSDSAIRLLRPIHLKQRQRDTVTPPNSPETATARYSYSAQFTWNSDSAILLLRPLHVKQRQRDTVAQPTSPETATARYGCFAHFTWNSDSAILLLHPLHLKQRQRDTAQNCEKNWLIGKRQREESSKYRKCGRCIEAEVWTCFQIFILIN